MREMMRNKVGELLPKAMAVAMAAVIALPMATGVNFETATADELSGAKKELDEKSDELSAIVDKIDNTRSKISGLQDEIDARADEIEELEVEIAKKQDKIAEMAVFFYKTPSISLIEYMLDSENVKEMMSRSELIYDYADNLTKESKKQRERQERLQTEIDRLSAQKDEQVVLRKDLKKEQETLKVKVESLKDKVNRLDAKEKERLFDATGKAFDTDFSNGEWHTCTASAYGGSTDPMTPNNARTATGTICNDYSMGVAIPMRWPNYRSLFGKKVEISYGGKSVVAKIVDCGGMQGGGPGGERGLDLQPGVFKAFGASSCSAWGLRAVRYRIL